MQKGTGVMEQSTEQGMLENLTKNKTKLGV